MKYLTRITLGRSQAACLNIADSYAWHRRLWEAFPGRDGESRDFLFRTDDIGRDLRVFLLSETAPVPPVWGHWEPRRIADSFLDHEAYRFQLRANPTMRRGSDGRRLAIYAEDRLREWILRKARQGGFDVQPESLVVGAPLDEYFFKNGRRGKHVSVDFQGLLTVENRRAFAAAFQAGIGAAKAFGFGLLMLQPVSGTQ